MAWVLPWTPLIYLWFLLIDHLRIEWTLNPQYTYGWAVPLLCLYLLWLALTETKTTPQSHSSSTPELAHNEANASLRRSISVRWWYGLFIVAAMLYPPTRLIQEANPEWRLVSWLLALEVIAFTLFFLGYSISPERFGDALFPIGFFLIAVPWPTLFEWPLIQNLTRANVGSVVESLAWMGIPALAQGNLIKTSGGTVGMEDACSGIRSLQASLMLALFLGALYRFDAKRRVLLCGLGIALAFAGNFLRTLTLVLVASQRGAENVGKWHDLTGYVILLLCFLGLWFTTLGLRSANSGRQRAWTFLFGNRANSTARSLSLRRLSLALSAWLVITGITVELWYRVHESQRELAKPWNVRIPREKPGIRSVAFSEKTRPMLRYDSAENVVWEQENVRWQLVLLKWLPGRANIYLANLHKPVNCLTATGRKLCSDFGVHSYTSGNGRLPFHVYKFREPNGCPLHVFACVWESLTGTLPNADEPMTVKNRLRAAWNGRRNPGQQNLEMALWGLEDESEAEAAFQKELQSIVTF